MKTSFQYELKGDRFLVYLLPADVSSLSANVKEMLDKHGVEIVEIIIDRDGTNGVADHSVLIRISSDIAEVLIDNPNIILYYSCDDINPIPGRNTKSAHKDIPVQEYRDRIFNHMFNLYMKRHPMNDIANKSIRIDGDGYSEFLHLICKDAIADIAQTVKDDILEGWGKPEV